MVCIIAECGVNHGGSVERALDLVDSAHIAGADIAKFQTYQVHKLLRNSDPAFDLLEKLSLPFEAFQKIARHCEAIGIEFCSTPGDVESLEFLVRECGVKRVKIGSDDLTNQRLVSAAFAMGLPLILSTGMATVMEINEMLSWGPPPQLGPDCLNKVTLLHCVSAYPTPDTEVNLRAMEVLSRTFHLPTGYSSHTNHGLDCVAAAARGAVMIEKHIALPYGERAVDIDVSLMPSGFAEMVRQIRAVEIMLGTGVKEPQPSEVANIPRFRKGSDGLRGAEARRA